MSSDDRMPEQEPGTVSGHWYRTELNALLLGAAALFIGLALFSYRSCDPSWFDSGWSDGGSGIANLAGILGAELSAGLFLIFGHTAWLLPLALLGVAALAVVERRHFVLPGTRWTRLLGMAMVVVASASLIALNSGKPQSCGGQLEIGGLQACADHFGWRSLPCGSGGWLGDTVGTLAGQYLGATGGGLLLLVAFLLGLSVSTGISWMAVAERLGAVGDWLAANCLRSVQRGALAWRNWRLRRRHNRLLRSARRKVLITRRPEETENAEVMVLPALPLEEDPPKPAGGEDPSKPTGGEDPPMPADDNVEPGPSEAPTPPVSPKKTVRESKKGSSSRRDKKIKPLSVDLLDSDHGDGPDGYSEDELQALSRRLESKLSDFNITAEVESVLPGPVITRFEIQPAAGIKVSRITALAKDLARSLAVSSVRVVEVIPGKSVVGIEIPNENRSVVLLRDLLDSDSWRKANSPLSLALGYDIAGEPVVVALDRMPHLLVAGTTGSGKSVGVNAMLLSLLFKSSPSDVRLLLVDPKMLELSVYGGVPHLLAPVITNVKEAANGLRWCVAEMERRYRLMAAFGVRNLAGYNKKLREARAAGEPLTDPFAAGNDGDSLFADSATDTPTAQAAAELHKLPYIVVVIDEFADMMMVVGKKVEELIARIAQKARAAGIHLILATQRPSVDVITGLIKANIPTRISFLVSSKIDSRTILDQAGAEQLLGHGDMLYLPPGSSMPIRVHGAFVSDEDVHRAVAEWKQQAEVEYVEGIAKSDIDPAKAPIPGLESEDHEQGEEEDALYNKAVQCVLESRRASASYVQRRLRIGYNRAARLLEQMEDRGVVSPMGSNGNREVLAPGGDPE